MKNVTNSNSNHIHQLLATSDHGWASVGAANLTSHVFPRALPEGRDPWRCVGRIPQAVQGSAAEPRRRPLRQVTNVVLSVTTLGWWQKTWLFFELPANKKMKNHILPRTAKCSFPHDSQSKPGQRKFRRNFRVAAPNGKLALRDK